jgi:hypothetical protein
MSGQPDLGTIKDFGRNAFLSNSGWEVYNNTPDTIYARYNDWESFDSLTIDANHIFDDDENSSKGIIIFMPPQKILTDVKETDDQTIPNEVALQQNYPNPFNPSTKIKYEIPAVTLSQSKGDVYVTLIVYDVLGNEVTILVKEEKPPGIYEVEFDASNLSSGIYFYRLQSDNFIEIKKMVLLR